MDLVEEMLDKLPKEIWKDPSKKWADICSKSGVYGLEIILRLMKNLPIKDETKRYQHVITNMLSIYVNVDYNKWVVSKTVYGNSKEIHRVKLLEINKIKEAVHNSNKLSDKEKSLSVKTIEEWAVEEKVCFGKTWIDLKYMK